MNVAASTQDKDPGDPGKWRWFITPDGNAESYKIANVKTGGVPFASIWNQNGVLDKEVAVSPIDKDHTDLGKRRWRVTCKTP